MFIYSVNKEQIPLYKNHTWPQTKFAIFMKIIQQALGN